MAERQKPDPTRRAAESRGRRSEALAALFLQAKFYRVLARRYRTPVGEIDLIVARGRTIAFVEVKNRREAGEALEAVTPRAQGRIARAAGLWLSAHPAAAGHDLRFDIVAVLPGRLPRHFAGLFDWTGAP